MTYNPSGVAQQTMQSQQVMQTGGAYNGTVYEPFSNAMPSEASNPAKAPGGPRKDQASGRNPGEVDPNAASNQSPIGEPWVMAFFALAFAGVIATRKYKRNLKQTENSSSSTMKNHLSFKLLALFVVLITCTNTAWAWYSFTAGKTIYYDNHLTQWSKIYLRVGKEANDGKHSDAYEITKDGSIVNGTKYLYSYTLPTYGEYKKFGFANNAGWTGDNGIDQPYIDNGVNKPNDAWAITGRTVYFEWSLDEMRTFVPTTKGGDYAGAAWYNVNVSYNSVDIYSVTYETPSNGTLTVTKYNGSTYDAFSSGTNVKPTQIMKIVASPNEGYELTNLAVTGATQIDDGDTYYVTGNATITATFAPTYTVNIPAGVHGTVTVTGGSTGDNAIGQNPVTITASSPIAGCYFAGWIVTGGAHVASTSDATTTVTATGDGSVTANFAPRFALIGSDDSDVSGEGVNGMPGWGDYSKTLNYVAENDFQVTLPLKGNTNYKFRLRDLKLGKNLGYKDEPSGSIGINDNASGHWLNDYNHDVKLFLSSIGSDEVTFKITGFGDDHVTFQVWTSDNQTTSHTVNFNSRNFFVDGTKTTATTGGTVTAVDWKSYELTTGQKAKSGKPVVFTATLKDGYTFAGWYSDVACTSPYVHNGSSIIINDAAKTLTLTIDGNKTVYAKFTENSTEVYLAKRGSGDIEVQVSGVWTNADNLEPKRTVNVGVHTTYNIRATAASGNYFAKWDKVAVTDDFQIDDDEEEDYGEDNPSGVLKGKGAGLGTQMLYANFYELDKVYFRNWDDDNDRALWDKVYVYFSINYENGPESKPCAKTNVSADFKALMTRLNSTSNVYWAYVPRGTSRAENACDDDIAFSDHEFGTDIKFYENEGVMRGDYKASLDMFVPTHSDYETLNSTKYYKGYWKKSYGYEGFLGGYTLKQYSGSSYSSVPNSNFKIVDINTIQTTFYVKNITKDYDFMIESAGEVRYVTSPVSDAVGTAVYANTCSNVTLTEYNSGTPRFRVHPNKEGWYTFTIDQSGDQMKLSIEYPEAVGDYRIKHTYNSGAKTTYSNAVKAAKVADTDTVSLFLSNVGSPVTVLQKCTLINASTKLPEWEDLNSTNLSGFNGNEPGVYKIGITVTNDAVSNTPEVEAYTGDYYIHVNAKTKNYLTTDGYPRTGNSVGTKFTKFVKNSKLGDTYDHYWVDWFQKVNDAGDVDKVTEAQSVVATIGNDYSNDLAGELGDDEYSDEGKTLSDGANVRYGYDSKSNTFTRAMITCAGTSIMIANSQGSGYVQIYNSSNSTWEDAYSAARSSKDADNWIYTFNAKVREGSTATTTSSYNGQSMTLADGQKLLGGTGSNVYEVDVMYDFKTNRLISAWVPNPATEYKEPISLESNLMVVRREAGSPTLLNLVVDDKDASKEGGLLKVKQVYTVMEFTKANWANSAWTTTGGGYKDAYFWISLPYDCYVSDIFGIPNYGSEDGSYWVLQTYRGDLRAEKGWWAETESWWYDMDRDDIMKANQGYVIRLTNLDDLGKPFHEDGDIGTLRLYFPSANPDELTVGILKSDTVINYPEIKCTIVRDEENHAGDPNYDRRAIDSNWRIIGSPCFNSAKISTTGWGETYPTSPDVIGNLQFFYTWSLDGEGKPKYTIQNASAVSAFEFKATHAYFVQYAGNITWTNYSATPFVGFRAPERAQEATEQTLQLVLNKNGEQADVTYIKRMEEGATEDYDLNKDLSKVMNGRMANLYTIAGYYKMGGNCLPDTTSIVPVGVRTAVAGDYTFSMPEGTNGTGVYLIDNVAGTRTNLALGDYTVTLAKGTFDDRFSLELSPIAQTPTDIEQTGADVMDSVRKVMVDGILYIVKDGRIYDATGNRVQ